MEQNNKIGILFYSNKCKYSQNIRKIMYDQGILQWFKQISIDESDPDELIRTGLRVVPTLIIHNNNKRQILEENKAFEWVENIIRSRRETEALKNRQNTDNNNQNNNNNQNPLINNTKPMSMIKQYDPSETKHISDIYSYWTDDLKKDINIAQPKNFLPYGKDDNYNIMTIVDNIDNNKLTTIEQQRKIKELIDNRTTQDRHIMQLNEKQQIDAYIKNEMNIL